MIKEYLTEDKNKKIFDLEQIRRFSAFVKPYWATAVFTVVFLLVKEVLPFLFPGILAKVIDGPVAEKDFDGVLYWIGIYLGIIIVHSILYYSYTIMSRILGLRVIHDLRIHLFEHVSRLGLRFFHRTPIGRLMTRLTNDVDSLNSLVSEGLFELFSALLMIIYATVVMLYLNWKLGLITLAFLPLMLIVTGIFRVKVKNINVIIRKELAALNSILQESLNGISIVQIFNKQRTRFRKFKEYNRNYRNAYFKNVKYYSVYFPTVNSFSEFSVVACYFWGSYMIFDGEITTGTLVAFTWYANMFSRPLREISDKITNLQTAMAAGDRVFGLLDTEVFIKDGEKELPEGKLGVNFQHVHFGYDSENPVLKNISFDVEPGSTTAIVGATGSGKSTILSLLNRYYLSDNGAISVGGKKIEDLKNSSIRQKIANVSQDIFLFKDSIKNNIVFGNEWDEELFQSVIEITHVKDIVNQFPEGVEFQLDPGGKNISLGQRQLISFARALYAQPEILLLDEATSSVDTNTESLIQDALEKLLKNRTAIVVAHRLSTIKNADKILVIHQGVLKEEGTHQELIEAGGIYSKLVKMQFESHQ